MKSLLIANRGEIACRVISSAKRRGIRTIAVYSDADKQALHVQLADEAVYIGASTATSSYLSVERIIGAARSSDAQAIHPGYGFLSENPALVDACEAAGIVFVGPSANAMRAMGLKDAAKRLMEQAGVPVVPGYHGESQEESLLLEQAAIIGYPVLIKARAGGGGKGMRKVDAAEDFPAALQSAQREALASFGDACVLIEKYIRKPRHIEVQIFGDKHGNVVHLFERDCSLQRRHQKVIEEAPAPGMSEAVRKSMTDAAVAAAKAIDYYGAGTIEFIVDGSEELRTDGFWFMEMNTRLQVEHPVTEAITGVDLVDWQLQVADGLDLPLQQSQLSIRGHAVEARLYAENPSNDFMPSSGTLERLAFSTAGRVDTGVVEGDLVQSYYDPLLAKLIAHSDCRESAFQQLASQLASSVVMGMQTNREFLWQLVSHPHVLAGEFDTTLIEAQLAELTDAAHKPELASMACVELVVPGFYADPATASRADQQLDQHVDPFTARSLGAWQLWGPVQRSLQLQLNDKLYSYTLLQASRPIGDALDGSSTDGWLVNSPDMPDFPDNGIFIANDANIALKGQVLVVGQHVHVQRGYHSLILAKPLVGQNDATSAATDSITAPMPGRVVAVHCAPGESIKAGQAVISIEAMKMEQELCADRDGVVELVLAHVGDQVSMGKELVRLEEVLASPASAI